MSDPVIALVMLGLFIFIIMLGFPIAFTLIAMGVMFGYYAYFQPGQAFFDNRVFYLLTQNTFSVMNNDVLIAVPLFRRLGLGSVLGYLAAGLAIGPFGLGLVGDPETILHSAEMGVVLFLFIVGLEMEPAKLWGLRNQIFGLGLLQVALCGALLTLIGIFVLQLSPAVAFVAGLGFVMTSTAIVMQLLGERGELQSPSGQKIVSEPRCLKARRNCFTCRSALSDTMRILSDVCTCSAKGLLQHLPVPFSRAEGFARLDGRDDHFGRAEEMRVDRVEVALERLEDLRKGLSVVARPAAWQLLGEVPRSSRTAANEQLHQPAIDDRVVRPSHRLQEIGMGCRNRCAAGSIDDIVQREMQAVRLVKGHLQRAADDLHAAGKALRRGVDEGQRVRRQPRRRRHFLDDGCRRRLVRLQQENGGGSIGLAVGDLFEQRFHPRQRPCRPGAHGEILLVRQAPARILAGEAGKHRLR